MTAKTFSRGDTVYGIDGQQAEYLMAYGEAHLVLPHFRDEDEFDVAPWPGEPAVWEEAFAKPPVPVVHEDVAAARVELDDLQAKVREAEQQLHTMREERAQLQRDQAAVRTRLAEHQGLQQIDDFLAGRITHFVVVSNYHAPQLKTFDEVIVREHRRSGNELRLLGLFGDASRGLRWKVTPYGDGSGSMGDEEVIPCTSLEQAQQKVAEMLVASWPQVRNGSYPSVLIESVAVAHELGLQVPADLVEKVDSLRREVATRVLQQRRQEFERAQQQLRDAEAAAGDLVNTPTAT